MEISKLQNQTSKLYLLFLYFSISFHSSYEVDRITPNQSLSGDQTILSAGGLFKLGFFRPGNSSNYYIGMWYNQVSEQTIVWVANRETPVSDKSTSVLKISNGNLVLINESKLPVWSTNVNFTIPRGSVKTLEAVLQDDGNLVLQVRSHSLKPLWQSFDHPAHTWLPGTRIGLDNRTGVNTVLTSWKNAADPAPGLFSLELDPNGSNSYIILWNKTKQYWSSGPWNGHIFSLVPEMRLNFIYNFSYVTNVNESYFTYSLYNSTRTSRFIMDISGQVRQLQWLENTKKWNLFWSQPRQQCEVNDLCGPFGGCKEESQAFCVCLHGFEPRSSKDWNLMDYSNGCMRKKELQCRNVNTSMADKRNDKFFATESIKLPEDPIMLETESVSSCKSVCLSNCSCVAYAYENNQCYIWSRDLLSTKVSGSESSDSVSKGYILYIRLAASECK